MTVSKNPTSYKLSLEVENGVNAIGAPCKLKALPWAVCVWKQKPTSATQLPKLLET